MHYLYGCVLVLLCALIAINRDDSSSWSVFLVAAILTAGLFLKQIPQSILIGLGLTATACMLVCFGEFFVFVHLHDGLWYSASDPGGAWCHLLAGFAMVQVIAAFSCRLKENTSFDSPNEWFKSLPNVRRRIEETRISS